MNDVNDNISPPAPLGNHDRVVRGIVFAALAFFLLAVMNAMAKLLSDTHHVVEIAFYRNLFAIIPFLLYILATKQLHLFKTRKPKAMAFRSVFGVVSLVTTFAAFKALPMAEVTVILFTASLMIPALSFFILKEPVGIYRWGAIVVGMCGVVIMAGMNGFSGGVASLLGIGFALAGAVMHAGLGIVLRYMKTESPVTITFYFVLTGMILMGFLMPFFASIPTLEEWGMFVAIGMTGAAAQMCLASAYRNAPASAVSPFNYTGLIWASGFDIFLWNMVPGWPVFLGGFVVIASSLFIAYREKVNERKARGQ